MSADSVHLVGHPPVMLLVRVACSSCPGETEVLVYSLEDVDSLWCDCEYGYLVLSVSEVELV